MKTVNFKKHLAVLVLAGTLFSISSCKKEEKDDGSKNKLSVEINGAGWKGSIKELKVDKLVTLNAISGTSIIQLVFTTENLGSYDLSKINPIGIQYMKGGTNAYNNMIDGVFTINQNSESGYSGTFFAVIASSLTNDTIVLSNGSFNYSR